MHGGGNKGSNIDGPCTLPNGSTAKIFDDLELNGHGHGGWDFGLWSKSLEPRLGSINLCKRDFNFFCVWDKCYSLESFL